MLGWFLIPKSKLAEIERQAFQRGVLDGIDRAEADRLANEEVYSITRTITLTENDALGAIHAIREALGRAGHLLSPNQRDVLDLICYKLHERYDERGKAGQEGGQYAMELEREA